MYAPTGKEGSGCTAASTKMGIAHEAYINAYKRLDTQIANLHETAKTLPEQERQRTQATIKALLSRRSQLRPEDFL